MRSLAVLAVLLVPLTARADVLPDGHKGIKESLRVEAEVPSSKALVLANTFEGGTLVVPGTDQEISWHPLGGEMQLRLVGAGAGEAIKAAAANLDREKIKSLLDGGAVCGASFAGVRTIVDTSPAVEVRWTWRASISGEKCTAELVKQEYLDATGKAVPAPPAPGEPKPANAPLADPPKPDPAPAPTEPPPPVKAAEPPATKAAEPAASGCQLGDPSPAALAGLGLLLGLRRRRR